jgi:hypothetical protein
MLSSILTKVGFPVILEIVRRSLEKIDNPVAQNAAKALNEFEAAIAGGLISPDQMAEANRHAEKMAELKSKEFEAVLSEVNQSLRAEVASNDAYVRRMRPTFGYLMAMTWAAQMFAAAYVIIFETEKAPLILQSMGSLSAIWAVGLSVLGIYVYKRSEDKKNLSQLIDNTTQNRNAIYTNEQGLSYTD